MPIDASEFNLSRIPHSLLIKLRSSYDSLKTAEKKSADLLLSDPIFFSKATIAEAADRANCSEATFTRLAQRLGFKGYPDLKGIISEGEKDNSVAPYDNLGKDDSPQTVVSKVFEATIQALNDTLSVLDLNKFEEAVNALMSAQKIMLCGAGDAATVAMSGYQKFIRAGLNVVTSQDPDVQLILASNLGEKDVVIAISHSGRTKNIVDAVKYAKSNGACVIAITNFPVSQLSKNSDIVLLTAAFTEHLKGEILAKRVTELCILESLFVNLLIKKSSSLKPKLEKSNDAIQLNKL